MAQRSWSWWKAALKGDFGPIHENDPQVGYYRRKSKDGGWIPVAIWESEDGSLLCADGEQERDATDVWTWCCRNPISYDLYVAVVEKGEPWPDLPPQAGHNLGSTALETLSNELEGERIEIERLLKDGPITDKATADRLSNWTTRIAEIGKKAEAERVAEKRPHDQAAAEVQAKWKPLIDDASALVRRMKGAIGAFLNEQRRKDAIARAEAAKAGEALRPAPAATSGTVGRKIALRTVKDRKSVV